MRATYGQVKNVLEAATEFHRDLERLYGQLAAKTNRQDARMLLDYMSRDEKHFEQALVEMQSEHQEKVLEAWMQYEPDDRVLDVPHAEELRDGMTVDDILELALRLDEKLVVFYTQAAELVELPEAKDLFSKLAEQQEDRRREFKVNVLLTQST